MLFPVEEAALKKRLKDILDLELKDTVKAHILTEDGRYIKHGRTGKSINSQELFFKQAEAEVAKERRKRKDADVTVTRRFIPEEHK